jgi:hypothetical protein
MSNVTRPVRPKAVVWKRWGSEVMHHLKISIRRSQIKGASERGVVMGINTNLEVQGIATGG